MSLRSWRSLRRRGSAPATASMAARRRRPASRPVIVRPHDKPRQLMRCPRKSNRESLGRKILPGGMVSQTGLRQLTPSPAPSTVANCTQMATAAVLSSRSPACAFAWMVTVATSLLSAALDARETDHVVQHGGSAIVGVGADTTRSLEPGISPKPGADGDRGARCRRARLIRRRSVRTASSFTFFGRFSENI